MKRIQLGTYARYPARNTLFCHLLLGRYSIGHLSSSNEGKSWPDGLHKDMSKEDPLNATWSRAALLGDDCDMK